MSEPLDEYINLIFRKVIQAVRMRHISKDYVEIILGETK